MLYIYIRKKMVLTFYVVRKFVDCTSLFDIFQDTSLAAVDRTAW